MPWTQIRYHSPMTTPRLASIQVGQPREMNDEGWPDLRTGPWVSAIIKERVQGPAFLSTTNLAGDAQGNPATHGGPDKAVLGYAASHYSRWSAELGIQMPHGAFGENLTIEGLDEGTVCIGDIYQVGEAVVQISSPRQPCWKIARRWGIKTLTAAVDQTGRTGWYHRVLAEGSIQAGDEVKLLERPNPGWTVMRATRVMQNRRREMAAATELATLDALAAAWKQAILTAGG
jgi:MOSC domain-containing protein YiiM